MTGTVHAHDHGASSRLARMEGDHFWFAGRDRLVQELLDRHPVEPDGVVVDLGSGTGRFARRLAAAGRCRRRRRPVAGPRRTGGYDGRRRRRAAPPRRRLGGDGPGARRPRAPRRRRRARGVRPRAAARRAAGGAGAGLAGAVERPRRAGRAPAPLPGPRPAHAGRVGGVHRRGAARLPVPPPAGDRGEPRGQQPLGTSGRRPRGDPAGLAQPAPHLREHLGGGARPAAVVEAAHRSTLVLVARRQGRS